MIAKRIVYNLRSALILTGLILPLVAAPGILNAQARTGTIGFNEHLFSGFTYRNLGPYRTGAWTVGVAVPSAPAHEHQSIIYAALRSGGVWKSSDGGVSFAPVLDAQKVYSMGAIAVAPSDDNIVWAGTGDNSATRSAYWGDGVYKSSDAGKTWTNMGLRDTQHIARIVIHPTQPNIVYVAAMGHLSTPNEQRGVFKTTDGGNTWKKVLYVGDRVGAVDLLQDPRNLEVLYAATYEHLRLPWMIVDGGPGTGLYKTTDGGTHWRELTNGLPKGPMGRIGIDLCLSRPDTLYAVYDNHRLRPDAKSPRDTINGQVYRSDDAGASWRRINPDNVDVSGKAGYSFNQIRVDPNNPDRAWITGSDFHYTPDGGKTWIVRGNDRPFGSAFGDFRSLWIDPQDSQRMIATSDGGVFESFDGGRSSQNFITIKGGEVYGVDADREIPYNIYEGLQDHENWRGPSEGWAGSIGIGDWVTTGQGDGMYNRVDPTDSRWVYNTQEFGSLGRYDQKTHERVFITPKRAQGEPPLRVNWIAPFTLSPEDPKTIYAGAQVLLRSTDRGDHWQEVSPDLTTNDPEKTNRSAAGSAIQYCTITTISESPLKPGILWVGTDDGKVQMSKDGGALWTDVTPNIVTAGGPASVWTSRVYASRFAPGSAYIAKTGRRQDDFKPYLFKTIDYGATWTSLSATLPQWPVNSIVEDTQDPSVLFAGTDIGVFVSHDTGTHWVSLQANMPPAAVTDMVFQPQAEDLVVGTFGRGTWILNIAPVREMTGAHLSSTFLFPVQSRPIRQQVAQGNYRFGGDSFPTSPNGMNGLLIDFYLERDAQIPPIITVADAAGKVFRTLKVPATAGLHRLSSETQERVPGTRPQPLPAMPPGKYVVTLTMGETHLTREAEVLPTPTFAY
jgi:photosystem II stability/assembly factor-like uncharacterized protein